MNKKLLFILSLLVAFTIKIELNAQTTLSTGDIAFVMLNLDASPMTWSWVPLVDISTSTVIYFTDDGWNGYTSAFVYDEATLAINNDDLLSFTVTSPIPKGTVITFNGSAFSPSYGTISWIGVVSPSSTSGDQMLAFQGTFASPSFIAGVHSDYNSSIYDATTKWATNNENASYIGLSYSSLPPGLTNGTNAVSLFPGITESDNAKYTGSTTSGTKTELLAAINNYANWSNDNTTPYTWSGNFTVNAELPVELTSFTANTIENKVTLNWQTATEVNNYGFEIERSQNNNWEKVGFVEGHGNSNSPKDYSFTDKPANGSDFKYRLKQVDFNGNFEFSPEIEVSLIVPQFSVKQNYPNPFNPSTKIEFSIPKSGNVKLSIFNAIGQEVAVLINENMEAGNHNFQFSSDNYQFSSGIYFYKVISGKYSETKKMILLR